MASEQSAHPEPGRREDVSAPVDAASDAQPTGRRLGVWAAIVALLSLVSFVGNLTTEPEEDFIYQWALGIGTIFQDGILLLVVFLLARPWYGKLLAWRPPISYKRAAGLGAALIAGIYVLAIALSPLFEPGEEQGLVPREFDGDRIAPLVFNSILIVTFVPVVEELMFRGIGLSLLRRYGDKAAVLVSGLAFAGVHGLLEGLVVFTAFGAGLAYLRLRTRSVWPCIAVHAIFNGVALTVALLVAD
jgi:membrane protease YdiL (CAAX protease family)